MLLAGCVCGCVSHHAQRESHSAYTNPLRSPGAQFGALPPAVQRTVRAEAGATPIVDVVKYEASGRTIYGIYFQNPDAFPPLFAAADGSVLNRDFTTAVGGVGAGEDTGMVTAGAVSSATLNDLPPAAVQTIRRRAPDAEIDTITRETHGTDMTYRVTFKGGRYPPLEFNREGLTVNEVPVRVRTR